MISNRVALPFVLGAIFSLYLTWTKSSEYALWLAVFAVCTAVIYILSPQIDWWWANRNPPDLPKPIQDLFSQYVPWYQNLDDSKKTRFRQRVALTSMATDWTPMGWDAVPIDVQYILASYPARMTLNRENFVLEKFEKIIVYPHPFPSPLHLALHSSELYAEDGCILFNVGEVMSSFKEQTRRYQIAMHEYARAYVLSFPELPWPRDVSWEVLENISGISKNQIEHQIGLPVAETLPVAIHHYFTFRSTFRGALPEVAAIFDSIFEKNTPAQA